MKRYKQYQSLVIDDFEAEEWQHPVHQHNHYELIYIKHGAGQHFINHTSIEYTNGDLFLIGPDDEHYFHIEERTSFIFIKFTDVYIHQIPLQPGYGLQYLEYLIKSRETHVSVFRLCDEDQFSSKCIIEVIRSLKPDTLLNEQLIWLQVLALATLMQRNMPQLAVTKTRSRDMQAVFCYIHKFIYAPKQLRAPVMAAHFNTTADYIGPYFKRNAGVTLRAYIARYRQMLMKQRLESGNYSLKQIAAEFDLTDESHVSKLLSRTAKSD
jgi:AraC family L-rhamnose operon regulatory protein RhaS